MNRSAAKRLLCQGLVAVLAVAPALAARPASAAEIRVSTEPSPVGAPPQLRGVGDTIELSLEDAIAIALQRNLSLVLERFTNEQFELGIDQALGIFDLRTDANLQLGESTSPTTSDLDAGAGTNVFTSESQTLNLGLNQLTPIGGEIALDFNNSRREDNSVFSTLNPAFNSSVFLGYSLPLLRNFGRLPTKQGLINARLRAAGNLEFFEQQVIDTVQQVENAYWTVVESRDQLAVAQESLALAEELDRRNRVQVDVGTLPPLELVRSEANIATRAEEIIRARTAVDDAADVLRQLLNLDQGDLWDMEIVPVTEPATEEIDITLAEAIATALAERPELDQLRLEVERLEVDAAVADDQVLPSLNLFVGYGVSGVGGDVVEQVPIIDPDTGDTTVVPVVTQPGGYGDALDQVRDGDFDNWALSLTFAYPIQNRTARAQRAIAHIEVDKGNTRLAQLEQVIITEVRTAVRAVESAVQQVESAKVSRQLQERNLEAEQKRYENGMSTSFEITVIQEDLALARSREVSAISGYRRALAEYYRSIGELLESKGIEIVGDDTPREQAAGGLEERDEGER